MKFRPHWPDRWRKGAHPLPPIEPPGGKPGKQQRVALYMNCGPNDRECKMFDFDDLESPVSFCGGGEGGDGDGIGQCTADDPYGTAPENNNLGEPTFGEIAQHVAVNSGITVEFGTGNIGISANGNSCAGCHDPFGGP